MICVVAGVFIKPLYEMNGRDNYKLLLFDDEDYAKHHIKNSKFLSDKVSFIQPIFVGGQ